MRGRVHDRCEVGVVDGDTAEDDGHAGLVVEPYDGAEPVIAHVGQGNCLNFVVGFGFADGVVPSE